MKLPLPPIIHLLHSSDHGTLATQSTQLPGYPFASVLPFVLDEQQRPVFLLSGLAEHTRNLQADPRASLLLHDSGQDVLRGARLTLLGEVEAIDADAHLRSRYLRYQPDAERYLALGDFRFYRLQPRRVRFIAGFGQMGWVEADTWAGLPCCPGESETALLAQLAADLPAHVALLGVDCFGIDLQVGGQRQRLPFADAPLAWEQVPERACEALQAWLAGQRLWQDRQSVSAYVTKDGSTIRELMHPGSHGSFAQSLAEATVPPATRTLLHRHHRTEELYHITAGRGLMTLAEHRFEVGPGDTVCIPPGTAHCIETLGAEPLILLCCCSPAYSHDDTELLEPDSHR